MRHINNIFAAVTMLLLPQLSGQTRVPAPLVASISSYSGAYGTRARISTLYVTESGVLLASGNSPVPTGVTVPGGLFLFWVGDSENALLCGLDGSGNEVVEHWKREAGSYQLQGQPMSFPSGQFDFIGVAYRSDSNKIYLLDRLSKYIYENSWDGSSQISPTGWQVWATPTTVSELDYAYKYSLDISPGGDKVALWSPASESDPFSYIYLYWDAQGFHVERSEDCELLECQVDAYSVSAESSSLIVRGVPGTSVEVVEISGDSVIGTGTIPNNDCQIEINLSSPLELGNKYLVRKYGTSVDSTLSGFTCPVRYGFSEPISSGITMSGMNSPVSYYIGSTAAMSFLATYKDMDIGEREPIVGYMAMAFRDQYGQDPIIQIDDNWLLNTIYYINVSGYVCLPNGHLAGHFQIPNDPALIGAVLLTQFWVIDGQAIRLSQIIGAKIEGQEELLRAPSGGSSRTSSLPLDQKFSVKTGGDAIVAQILKQRAK